MTCCPLTATMTPKWPSRIKSTAATPTRVAQMRSSAVGDPPRWRCPRTVTRGLKSGALFNQQGERITDAPPIQADMAERIGFRSGILRGELGQLKPFAHHNDAEVLPLFPAILEVRADGVKVRRHTRHHDEVGATSQPTGDSHPPGVTPHYLHHKDSMMGSGGGVESVQCVRHDLNGGVETDTVVGFGQVIVDGLWAPRRPCIRALIDEPLPTTYHRRRSQRVRRCSRDADSQEPAGGLRAA